MRTINTTFKTFGASLLLLGLKGDSNATEILIDCAESLEEYQGTMAAMSITGPDDTVYPGDISLDENGIVHWAVAARDCGIAGHGSARVDLVDDEGTVVASAEARTIVMKTNMQGVAPDQIANWTEAASVALQEARAALLDLIDLDTTATANEATRQLAETGRVSAETLRASAETARASAETARATAENTRASAESTRIAAENTRASAENTRIAAENARVSEFSTIEANAQAALSYIGPSEASSTASAAHEAGSYFIYNGKLYKATADIAAGDTITAGTNCAQVPGGAMGEVSELKSAKIDDTRDSVSVNNSQFFDKIYKDGSRTANECNPDYVEADKGINSAGDIADASGYAAYTKHIKLTKRYINVRRKFSGKSDSVKGMLAFYDSNGEFIQRTGISQTSPYDSSQVTGAASFRVAWNNESLSPTNYFIGQSDVSEAMPYVDYLPSEEVLSATMKNEYLPGYRKVVDLFLMMGQSNMAGRGITNQTWPQTAMAVDDGAGWEFRPITDPTKMYEIDETVRAFGYAENKQSYINDDTDKTGGPVPAFINAYYKITGVPVVAVSASQGGVKLANWLPNAKRYQDARDRWNLAVQWLIDNGYTIRHKYMLWCQGEADADDSTSASEYKTGIQTLVTAWQALGVEDIFVIRIGQVRTDTTPNPYDYMIEAQTDICQTVEHVILVDTRFAQMRELGMMKDSYHYVQNAYNIVGKHAGENVGSFVVTGKEPTMYDPFADNLYYSHKN